MERLIILVIWIMGIAFIKGVNKKNNEGKTKKGNIQQKRKNVFTFMEDLDKEIRSEKENQRPERPTKWAQPARPARPSQPTTLSDLPKSKAPSKPKAPTKPVGLEIDVIGGDEVIGEIKDASISIRSKHNNNLNLDLKRDLLKGIIYSEILSEPKSFRNMKRRC